MFGWVAVNTAHDPDTDITVRRLDRFVVRVSRGGASVDFEAEPQVPTGSLIVYLDGYHPTESSSLGVLWPDLERAVVEGLRAVAMTAVAVRPHGS